MPIETKQEQSIAICDRCQIAWVVGTSPRPIDFKMKKLGDYVEVMCVKCAPEPTR